LTKARLKSHERRLRKEKEEHGFYRDGTGKRYELGPGYMLLGDDGGALDSFRWFNNEFPDDIGEPGHLLCWSLALHRAGDQAAATRKLRQSMLSNLYVVPHLLGEPIAKLDIWHGSNWEEPDYVAVIPGTYWSLWTEADREWAANLYRSPEFISVRARWIDIGRALRTTPRGPDRGQLVREMHELRYGGEITSYRRVELSD
jgi:hypothetical protein